MQFNIVLKVSDSPKLSLIAEEKPDHGFRAALTALLMSLLCLDYAFCLQGFGLSSG